MQTAILVIAYEAEGCIASLLGRIPESVLVENPMILVSDDASGDATADIADAWAASQPPGRVTVVRQKSNLGYGGNQKFCYEWAGRAGADLCVLLHGDEQYPPESIAALVAPIVADEADAVYGSRMMIPGGARAGGMPVGRYVGNRVLSGVFNGLVGTSFTEWFSGFRAYRTSALAGVDLAVLPDGFDFDAAITMRLVEAGHRLTEVAIPTHYGDELSRVPLIRTGFADIRHAAFGRFRRRFR